MRKLLWMIGVISFFPAGLLLAQEKALSYSKSLSASAKDVAQEEIWAPDDIVTQSSVETPGEKALDAAAPPSIHEYRIPFKDGTLIVSQKWDIACGPKTCETRAVYEDPDGKMNVLNTDQAPQFPLEKTAGGFKEKSLDQKFVFLSPDQKNLEFRWDEGIYEFPLE
jgi:hypothetical protein